MISIGRTYSWASPMCMMEMYIDHFDALGLGFWYKDLERQDAENRAREAELEAKRKRK